MARLTLALLVGATLFAPLATAPSFAQTLPPTSSKVRSQPVATKTWYAVTLATRFRPFGVRQAKEEFPDRIVYLTTASVFGQDLFLLRMGFFPTLAEATAVKDKVSKRYPGAWVAVITEGEYTSASRSASESVAITVPIPAAPAVPATVPIPIPVPEPMPVPPPVPTPAPKIAASPATDLERQAAQLMEQGRAAIIREDNATAIDRFTKILALPLNSQTQPAQEFLGLSFERQGDVARARSAYEEYLRKYPEGDDATRVRQRLLTLFGEPAAPAPILREAKKKVTAQSDIYGSVSQYYYGGNSKIDTETLNPTANTLDVQSLSLTDQSALVNNLDFNWRRRSETSDDRFVLRETWTVNFLDDQDNVSRLTAAYYDHKSKPANWSARLGRQPGNAGGVIGRFDGLTAGKGLTPRWRLNAVGGLPTDSLSDTKPVFYGLNTEFGLFANRWSGNLYAIQQTVDGLVDRQAVGSELRYTAPRGAFFSLVDYDTSFGALNTAYIQGNWQNTANTSFNILLDRRKAPTLQLNTALIVEDNKSIAALTPTYSEEELRNRALALTATSTLASFGVTHPFNSTWQLGGDVRLTRITGTDGVIDPVSGMLEGNSTDSGDLWTYSLQAIATGLFTERDVTVLSGSLIAADTYDGQSFSLTNRALFGANWTLDSTLNWYNQSGPNGGDLSRLSPTFRIGYRIKDSVTLEAELGAENSDTTNAALMTSDQNRRRYYSIGYRWDF